MDEILMLSPLRRSVVDFGLRRTTIGCEQPIQYDQERVMKFICLGYMEEEKWDAMSQSERDAMMKECFAYDDVLRKNGHMIGGEALQSVRNATTLRWRNGKVSITDGPFAETKEQLGGILVLEAKELNHAIQLMSKHPSVRLGGCFELRPTEDIGLPDRLSDKYTHST
jgi:hypothetical protein